MLSIVFCQGCKVVMDISQLIISLVIGNFVKNQGYDGSVRLYNIKDDPSESINLAELRPDIITDLRHDLYI